MTELIIALDTKEKARAHAWVGELGESVGFYKVGLELFTAQGPPILAWLKEQGKKVFLDLKFHDIPNTAAGAVAAAARWGVDLCTVHAAGGREMLRACREACGETKLLAVTVLTSLDQDGLGEIGIARGVKEQVARLARLARETGCHGLVSAPSDLENLADLPPGFLRVTPGIRPQGSPAGDQKRVMTPGQAARAGATHIVVGRPITGAPDPAEAARAIIAELEG